MRLGMGGNRADLLGLDRNKSPPFFKSPTIKQSRVEFSLVADTVVDVDGAGIKDLAAGLRVGKEEFGGSEI